MGLNYQLVSRERVTVSLMRQHRLQENQIINESHSGGSHANEEPKILVGKNAHQVMVLELDRTTDDVDRFLDMMKIPTRDEDRANFREFFLHIAEQVTENYIINVRPTEDSDIEKKEIRHFFKPLDNELTRRFQKKFHDIGERLRALEQKRSNLHQLMKTQVDPRLNRCIDNAESPEVNMLPKLANGRTRSMEFEEFIELKLRSYYADISEAGNRLEILQSSFDSLKKEADNSLRDLQVRTHNLETVQKLGFEELEEYEKILQEQTIDFDALARAPQDGFALSRLA